MTCQPISKGMEQGYEQPQIHTTNNVGPQIDNNICVMVTKRKKSGIFQPWFMVGVPKMNVSPQNHFQDTTLDDHYVYEIIYLVKFIF